MSRAGELVGRNVAAAGCALPPICRAAKRPAGVLPWHPARADGSAICRPSGRRRSACPHIGPSCIVVCKSTVPVGPTQAGRAAERADGREVDWQQSEFLKRDGHRRFYEARSMVVGARRGEVIDVLADLYSLICGPTSRC